MAWDTKEYDRRLEKLSHSTLLLVSQAITASKHMEAAEIIMATESEEEIVQNLQQMLAVPSAPKAWDGPEFSRRLEKISYDTKVMIADILGTAKQKIVTRIIMETDDSKEADRKIQEFLRNE